MKLVNMEMSEEEREEENGPLPAHAQNKYPYGLVLSFNDEVIEKLGLGELPAVGTKFKIEAMASVIGVHADEVVGRESEASVQLQIEELGCEGEGKQYAKKMYDKTK